MSLIINVDPKIYDGNWEEYLPGVRVLVRPYTRRLVRRVMAAATVADPETGASRVDTDLWDRHLYQEIIGNIEGLANPDRSPAECSEAAIEAVCDQVEGFAAWVLAKSREAASAITTRVEKEVKNSKSSRGGKRSAPKG